MGSQRRYIHDIRFHENFYSAPQGFQKQEKKLDDAKDDENIHYHNPEIPLCRNNLRL